MCKLLTTLFLLSFAVAAFAQSDRGIITGTVTDTSGAVVANAAIQAKQLETGAVFPTTTTGTGNYTLTELPVGLLRNHGHGPRLQEICAIRNHCRGRADAAY